MKGNTPQEIRQAFFNFFEDKGHKVVPSVPLVVKDDPTLMFINAGMNPFKDYFLGLKKADNTRLADSQKCLRVSGKHNDLEEVGVDTYHHTLFEMLGNWSFGDYFKKEAIQWAWEFLTEVCKLDADRLYITFFEGDAKDKLGPDNEAKEIWGAYVGEDRILPFDRKDNFWEMGDIGPCGPCSEIHIDLRSSEEREAVDGASLVNQDHPQVIEIWNLVFMEFLRKADGSLENLPEKHVDTGMGFERLVRAIEGKSSNYDTAVFSSLLKKIEAITSQSYGKEEGIDIAMRVIADHLRAVSFAIADGQNPSNVKAGYVIRRILRRAVRYSYQGLNYPQPLLHQLVSTLVEDMGTAYPELVNQQSFIEQVILEEEKSFLKTLEEGIQRLTKALQSLGNGKELDGQTAFELYDTYGFPLDLTQLICSEKEINVDIEGFNQALAEQKSRSRAEGKSTSGDWHILREDKVEEFVGYDREHCTVHITKWRAVERKGKTSYQLVFSVTPFYAEGGGQVGDKGVIRNDNEQIAVYNTTKENDTIIHWVNALPNDLNASFEAKIDLKTRKATERNHSATHLLHEALRNTLGNHVEQRGSLVEAKGLRFDFSHPGKVDLETLHQIEDQVNAKIWENISLEENRNALIEEAKAQGAMALFGEKYGDVVRTIKFGSSIELCGGCHVRSTGAIGQFIITAESSVASGIRRIEAITGEAALAMMQRQRQVLHEGQELLGQGEMLSSITKLIEDNKAYAKKIESYKALEGQAVKKDWSDQVQQVGKVSLGSYTTDLDSGTIKDVLFQLKNEIPSSAWLVGQRSQGKVTLSIAFSQDLIDEHGFHAGNMVRELAKHIQGGGGGQPFFATAGGKNPEGLDQALQAGVDTITTQLSA
ncbi:MAG: alanine--tRNA ligase [Chitinophagales bacterium]